MTSLVVLVTAVLLLAPLSASATDTKTGLEFLRECEGQDQQRRDVGRVTCLSYLDGFLDSYALVTGQLPATWPRFCLPAGGVRMEQVLLVVTKWLRDNPSKLHQSARSSIYIALATGFPCRAQ